MSEGELRGVLLTHGSLAVGLIDAAERVAGPVVRDALLPLSNEGMDPTAIRSALEELAGASPIVVFTDLPAGSCAFAARAICDGRGTRAVVCGVNLPVLLDFVFHRDMPLDELVPRLVEKGRAGLVGRMPGGEGT